MRASRILALARTMRCASVGACVRKACAISSVVRPHTSRSVSATCASGDSAGWQQVKMRRSRSSSMPSSSRRLRVVGDRVDLLGDVVDRVEARLPAQAVDRLEAPGRDEPGARIGRHAVARPLLERRAKRVVQRFLGEVEVAEQAHQRREDAARLGAVNGFDGLASALGVVGHCFASGRSTGSIRLDRSAIGSSLDQRRRDQTALD